VRILSQIFLYLSSLWLGISPAISQFTEGVIGQPVSFLPHQVQTNADKTISRLIYRGLFKYDIYGSLVPDLAETWSISEDGLIYTIKLKNGQKWSNGKPITADDLIYTSYKVANLSGVGTDKVDDLTVRYYLPNKYSPFLDLLTIGVMPDQAEEHGKPLNPVSSGPFKVVRIEKSGVTIREVDLVHSNPNLGIRKLAFRFYANEEELITASKLGEVDGFSSAKDYEIEGFEEYDYPMQGVYYALYFNLRDEKYQDAELRKALRSVLPVEQLIFDRGITVQGPISRTQYTDRNLDFDHYDELFSYDYSDIIVEITVPDIKAHRKLVEDIAHLWEVKLKLEVNITEYDPEKIIDDVIKPRNFEILFYGQEVGRDPDRYVNWHSTQKEYPRLNISGYEQVRADRALEEGRISTDENDRKVHYNGFQTVVEQDAPVIFLYHPFSKYYVSQYVSGIGEKYTFSISDLFLDFENWKRVKTN